MTTDDKSGNAGVNQPQGQSDDKGQTGDSEPKFYTDEQVQEIVSKRVSKLAKVNNDLLTRLSALEKGTKKADEGESKDKDPLVELRKEI